MKKIYTLLLLLMTMAGIAKAGTKTVIELDQAYATIDAIGSNSFAIVNLTDAKSIYGSGAQNLGYGEYSTAFLSSNAGYMWKLEKISDESNETVNGKYLIRLQTPDGADYSVWGKPGYLNSQSATGWCSFILGLTKGYGEDGENLAVWEIENVEGKFALKNVGTGLYFSGSGTAKSETATYFSFYSIKETTVETSDFDFSEKTANTTTFDLTKATNYDLETGKFTAQGGWTFDDPVDLSAHKWLVVTTSYNASKAGGEFRIKDANGVAIGGEEYSKGGNTSRGNMWIDRWNNQICAAVNMEYLSEKGLDITKISSLTFNANQPISAVFLTNYEASQAVKSTQGWGACTGDYVREYAHLGEGEYKFGTIALNYAAAVSGAQVFAVESFDGSTMVLARHYGVLEAETPYIYMANDEVGVDGNGASNVNFFRIDENGGTATGFTADSKGNGLVGCYNGFAYGTANLIGCYVLNNNKLHKIDTADNEVTVGDNKCFFDPTKHTAKKLSAKPTITISTDNDATAINSVTANKTVAAGKVYDMNGREAKSLKKGEIYIMNGVKILVK